MPKRLLVLIILAAHAGASAQPTRDVVLAEAEMRDLPNTTVLVGTVDPVTRSILGSEIAGVVRRMPVRQGDSVQAGAVLVELDNESLTWQLEEAKARLHAAEAQLVRWQFEMKRIEHLYGDDQAGQREVYETTASFSTATHTVAERRAAVNRLESELSKARIVAPFAGYILRRNTEVGQWISRGGDVLEIVDLSTVLVSINVPEQAIPFVHTSDTAKVKIDALGRYFEGHVKHIIRQADPEARTFPIEIEIDNADQSLAAGMFARVTITSGPVASVVAVPKDAVTQRDGVEYVGLVLPPGRDGTKAVLTAVTTGKDIDDWVAITSGNISPGSRVVIRGNERLMPFPATVNVVDEFGTPIKEADRGDGGHGGSSHGGHGHGK